MLTGSYYTNTDTIPIKIDKIPPLTELSLVEEERKRISNNYKVFQIVVSTVWRNTEQGMENSDEDSNSL